VANAADLAHLETPRAKLEAFLTRAREISLRQAALAAERQELSKEMKGIIGVGQRLATLLRTAVKEHYGPRSEKLSEFGLQPFRSRKPKSQPEPEPEIPGPVSPDTSNT
jgi:hypothetical protein